MDTQTTTTETGAPVAVDAAQPVNVPANSIQQPLKVGAEVDLDQSKDQPHPFVDADKIQLQPSQPSTYQAITDVKNQGDALIAHVKKHGASHELSQAIAKIEEGIMWAIKHLGKAL